MKITRRSPFSGQINTREIPVTELQLQIWNQGKALIQDAMPNLSSDDREFIMTGITSEEWNDSFSNDPEDASLLSNDEPAF